jgi:hypothetical protein
MSCMTRWWAGVTAYPGLLTVSAARSTDPSSTGTAWSTSGWISRAAGFCGGARFDVIGSGVARGTNQLLCNLQPDDGALSLSVLAQCSGQAGEGLFQRSRVDTRSSRTELGVMGGCAVICGALCHPLVPR